MGSHGWTNYGKDDYCAISFNGLPREEKPVLIGWMNNWQYAAKLPTSPWRGQMSLPRRLSLYQDQSGPALRQEPITAPLRTRHKAIRLSKGVELSGAEEPPFELDLRFADPSEQVFGIRLYSDREHWTEIGFDRTKREFHIDRRRSGSVVSPDFPTKTVAPLVENRSYDLKIVVDRSSIESYAQNGTIAMTNLVFPNSGSYRITLFSSGGKPVAVTGDLWKLRPIWKYAGRPGWAEKLVDSRPALCFKQRPGSSRRQTDAAEKGLKAGIGPHSGKLCVIDFGPYCHPGSLLADFLKDAQSSAVVPGLGIGVS